MSKLLLKLIPSQVRIKVDVSYEVLFVDEFSKDAHQVGECRPEPRQIVIIKGLSPTETYKTFLHELLHAISNEYPTLNLTEKQVQLLEEGIFRVLKLNKVLDLLFKMF